MRRIVVAEPKRNGSKERMSRLTLVSAALWLLFAGQAMAASEACVAANRTVLEVNEEGDVGDGETGRVFNPGILFSEFEAGEVITVIFSNRTGGTPNPNYDPESDEYPDSEPFFGSGSVYWESSEDRKYFLEDPNESTVLENNSPGPVTFRRIVDDEVLDSAESLA